MGCLFFGRKFISKFTTMVMPLHDTSTTNMDTTQAIRSNKDASIHVDTESVADSTNALLLFGIQPVVCPGPGVSSHMLPTHKQIDTSSAEHSKKKRNVTNQNEGKLTRTELLESASSENVTLCESDMSDS